MPSPFPGMNPYFENPDEWPDFHSRFVPALADAIAAVVRPDFSVRVERRVYVRELPEENARLTGRPDITVSSRHPQTPEGGTAVAPRGPVVAEWVELVDELELPGIEILDRKSRAVVTAVELLSPSNKKPGADRESYLAKRRRVVKGGAALVELDLLRGGPRMPWVGAPACDYLIAITRPTTWPRAELWPLALRDALPPIPIPLTPGRTEPTVNLQDVLHTYYDRAAYDLDLYDESPDPPLAPADAAWAAGILAAAGITSS